MTTFGFTKPMPRIAVLPLVCVVALAQRENAILGTNPERASGSAPIVATGELATFFVQGLKSPDAEAKGFPLPLELSGVSVRFEEPRFMTVQLPILRIDQFSCGVSGLGTVCDTTAVTVQMPTDAPRPPTLGGPNLAWTPSITVFENGKPGFPIEVRLARANPYLLRDCSVVYRYSTRANTCFGRAVITHADGSILSPDKPGRPGEEVAAYAIGLGPTQPVVPTGGVTPTPAPTTVINYRYWITPEQVPDPPPDSAWSRPTFSGLVPGTVGLYQLNVRLPDKLPAGTEPCGGLGRNLALVVSAVGGSGYVAARFCMTE